MDESILIYFYLKDNSMETVLSYAPRKSVQLEKATRKKRICGDFINFTCCLLSLTSVKINITLEKLY